MINQTIQRLVHAGLLSLVSVLAIMVSQHSFASDKLIIAESQTNVPGNNGQFLRLGTPKINTSNNVVFSARLFNTSGGDADDSAIYRIFVPNTVGASIITLEEIAREDDFFMASDRSFHLGDLYIASSYLINNAPALGSPATGEFNNLALMLPLITGSGDLGDSIIAIESEGTFTLVAEAGATVESSNGAYREFSAFSLVGLSGNNDLTFFSALDNTENGAQDNTAYFKRYNNDSVNEIVRKGDSGSAGPITHPAGMVSNNYDASVFVGQNASEDSNNDSGLYKSVGSSYSIVVHEGDAAPSEDLENRFFSQLQVARINNQQEIGFIGTVRDEDGFALPNGTGLFFSANNAIKALLLDGQTTPDGTATFLNLVNYTRVLPNLSMNDLAQFALRIGVVGDLTTEVGQGDGIFRVSETEVTEIARKGDLYEDGNLRNFLNPALNNHGLVVFKADLQLTESVETDEGDFFILEDILIISDGIHYETIERSGQEHNGKIVRDIYFSNASTASANGLSDSGTVVYKVDYEDGTSSINAWNPTFGWRLEASEGDWDDVTHWHFGGLPKAFTDVVLDIEYDIELLGPSQATTIKSLALGGNTGIVRLTLKDGIFTTSDGMTIFPSSILSGQGTIASSLQNNGQIEISENQSLIVLGETTNEGGVTINAGSELLFSSLFKGNGTIQGTGTVSFGGELQLGDEPELLTIEGNVKFAEGSIIKLKIEGLERGESYDAMNVGSAVTLGGTLDVKLSDNINLENGNIFELLQGNQISGEFENIIVPNLEDQGLTLSINQTASKIELLVTQTIVVPDNGNAPNEATSSGGVLNSLLIILLLMAIAIRALSFSRRCVTRTSSQSQIPNSGRTSP